MKPGALPHMVEVRTLAARRIVIDGELEVTRMPRLSQAIAEAEGPARVSANFDRDEEGRYILDLSVAMPVAVSCQRCLSPMLVELASHSLLAALWTDDQAEHLPSRYDPLVTSDETDLWSVVEDELLLAMPAFSYHDNIDCGADTEYQQKQNLGAPVVEEPQQKDNPFSVLAALKGKGTQPD